MPRTITVKGVGKLSLKPDYTVVSLSLKTVNKVYDTAMSKAAEALDALRKALVGIGFQKDDLKTSDFNVGIERDSVRDKDGSYRTVFVGYAVRHQLKLEFDFDSALLSKTLGAIATCIAEPELNIQFTVKDKEAVNTALLESACANAREKAEILAKASGVALGALMTIDYNWGELHLYSPTNYEMDTDCMVKACAAPSMDIEPDDIDVTDSVTFVWEMN